MIVNEIRSPIRSAIRSPIGPSLGNLGPARDFNFAELSFPTNGMTFTRATAATITDHQGVVWQCASGEMRIAGARRVENLLASTETLSTQSVTVEVGRTYFLSFGPSTGSIALSGAASGTLAGSAGARVQTSLTASTTSLTLTVTGSVLQGQLELAAPGQVAPREYVSRGVLSSPFHGFFADGVRYFATNAAGGAITPQGVLIEEGTTNLLLQSTDLTTAWATFDATVSSNSDIAPDGSPFADRIVEAATTAPHAVGQGVTGAVFSASTALTASVYFKQGTRRYAYIQVNDGTSANAMWAVWDLQTGVASLAPTMIVGTFAGLAAAITAVGNGWYRCTLTWTHSANAGGVLYLGTSSDGVTRSFLGSTSNYVIAWGAQVEQKAYATSFVPTTGAAATRNADILDIAHSPWLTPTAGTWVVDAIRPSGTADYAIALEGESVGASAQGCTIGNNEVSNNGVNIVQRHGAVRQDRVRMSVPAETPVRMGLAWDAAGSTAATVGAVLGAGFAPGQSDYGTHIAVGRRGGVGATGGRAWNRPIGRVRFWPRRLPDATIQALTA